MTWKKRRRCSRKPGHGDGLDIELYALHIFPNDQLILELLQADLASIGVNLEVKTMDANAFLSKHTSGNLDDAFLGFISNVGGDYPDAYELLALVYAKSNQPPVPLLQLRVLREPADGGDPDQDRRGPRSGGAAGRAPGGISTSPLPTSA